MSYRPSVIAALLVLLATPASAGNVIDPYTLFPAAAGYGTPILGTLLDVTTSSGTENIDMPDSIPANTLILTFITANATTVSTAESGWSLVGTCIDVPFARRTTVWKKLVTTPGSEPSAVSWTMSTGASKAITIAFPGATSVDDSGCSDSGGTGTTVHTAPDVTPTAATGLIVSAAGGLAAAWTSNPTGTLLASNSAAGANRALAIASNNSTGTSPQGALTFTTTTNVTSSRISVAVH